MTKTDSQQRQEGSIEMTSTTDNTITGLTPELTDSETTGGLAAGLTAADTVSAGRLDNLGLVHQARITALTRTVNSLTAQYGAGSAQVVAAQANVTATKAVAARLLVVKQQTAATAPAVTSTGWAVWGHVYDSASAPLSGYCVFLVDAQKNYQDAYGFQFTGSNGSFVLNWPGKDEQGAQATATPPTAYLAITNARAQLVYEGSQALALVTGSALYVDTTLAAGEPVLGELPAEIKRVAQPAQDAKKA
jgi:hypothetical protein